MNIVTDNGYYCRENWDCDGSQTNISVYDNPQEENYLGELYGYSLSQFENEDGTYDLERLDEVIIDELNL